MRTTARVRDHRPSGNRIQTTRGKKLSQDQGGSSPLVPPGLQGYQQNSILEGTLE